MATVCSRHPFEYSENVCSSCGVAYCHDCLVYPKGPNKKALCVQCAIAASGVRSSARAKPKASKREIRRRQKELRGEHQQQQSALGHIEAVAPSAPPPPPKRSRSAPPPPVAPPPPELTSTSQFDPGWAVSWDEPEPSASDPAAPFDAPRLPKRMAKDPFAMPVDAPAPELAPPPPDTPRYERSAPAADGAPPRRLKRSALNSNTPMPPAPVAPAPAPPAKAERGESRRAAKRNEAAKLDAENQAESSAMLSWIDNLIPDDD